MIKSILVPTDFSKQAESALKVAAQIAKKNNAKIYLLHILELPMHLTDLMSSGAPGPAPEAVFFMKQTHKKFEEVLNQDYLKDIDVIETVNFEDVLHGIINSSTKNNIDIIIMGSHGSTGFEELFIGSNAEKVVRTSKKPVLVIKEDCDIFEINDFVYATNFDDEDKPCLLAAHDFSKSIQAKLHLVWINTANGFKTTYETEEKMNNMISNLAIEGYSLNIYNDNTVEKGILNFADSINAGMIGISTHGRKGISHFINGSLGEDVVNHAKRPVLTFKI
ncbi:nucleotide-binding universal stress UspA family protein [Aquimarina sp. EL_43]|uniref:universal stress protein n=1 Tax=Aquimarina TaxID=290174 RepID=UPI0004ADCAD3|nr:MULTISPECIES: universal stress protein [Aquimarina]MBG6132999.1 nucleotide-binding universal stress UspA family protein [Aquimarina sp. EL_35]MBG6152310.1 nucleotide-binding universal stress UspA family protein [Aquimarina sp. EL_32]MBG6171148.1 nucleotide-binding universal stress UspA family protein [Aquimarina sp. EL_43]